MPRRISCVRLTEEAREQRNEYDADQGYAAARHELLHALGLCAGVIVAVTFHEVNDAPDTETGTESNDESLKNTNCGIEKTHYKFCRNPGI